MTLPAFDFKALLQKKNAFFFFRENCIGCDSELVTGLHVLQFVITHVIKQIGLPLRGRPILFITGMITHRIGLHSVPLPL